MSDISQYNKSNAKIGRYTEKIYQPDDKSNIIPMANVNYTQPRYIFLAKIYSHLVLPIPVHLKSIFEQVNEH